MNSSEQQQLQNCFFNPSWDQNDLFDSALSSIVSSPVAATAGEGVMLRELIGRLGTIRDSSQISPESYANLAGAQSPPFSADPGFAERAARYSCFAAMKIDPVKVSGSQSSSPEGSSVSDQISAGVRAQSIGNGRKRKPKSTGKDSKVASEDEGSKAKKSKQEDKAKEEASEIEKKGGEKKQKENNSEPPKDYIHVRARRGQATDSHSLAERVRREKISERMKFLQDLVPGCNKVTGKAVMLDEIINYVQSLQRQVEFLSMKLSTVNPRMDFNMEALLSKETLQSLGSLQQGMYPMYSSAPAFPYGYGSGMPLPPFDGFGDVAAPPQVSGFWEEDFQSLVQVGFCPNQAQDFQGQMKVEL